MNIFRYSEVSGCLSILDFWSQKLKMNVRCIWNTRITHAMGTVVITRCYTKLSCSIEATPLSFTYFDKVIA